MTVNLTKLPNKCEFFRVISKIKKTLFMFLNMKAIKLNITVFDAAQTHLYSVGESLLFLWLLIILTALHQT